MTSLRDLQNSGTSQDALARCSPVDARPVRRLRRDRRLVVAMSLALQDGDPCSLRAYASVGRLQVSARAANLWAPFARCPRGSAASTNCTLQCRRHPSVDV